MPILQTLFPAKTSARSISPTAGHACSSTLAPPSPLSTCRFGKNCYTASRLREHPDDYGASYTRTAHHSGSVLVCSLALHPLDDHLRLGRYQHRHPQQRLFSRLCVQRLYDMICQARVAYKQTAERSLSLGRNFATFSGAVRILLLSSTTFFQRGAGMNTPCYTSRSGRLSAYIGR